MMKLAAVLFIIKLVKKKDEKRYNLKLLDF